jgi:lipoyl-dependent peroxiredoxin
MAKLYNTAALSTGDGRIGHVRSADGALDLDLAVPKELGGAGGATNPEQLFAAGYAACFHSALKHVARSRKIALTGTAVTAAVGLDPTDQGGYALVVDLSAEVGGVDQATAEELVAAAHEVCPYSNATRGNIPVTLTATAG